MERVALKRALAKVAVILSIVFFVADTIYRTVYKITYFDRENCILYQTLPRPVFLIFEYFIELFLIVIFGIFLATLVERYFAKYRRFYPKNPITAFLYGSLIPICSCTAIPLIKTMKGKLNFRTIITFIIAAPLLSPYIIMLSFSVLGLRYGILRIVCSFILAVSSGYLLDYFHTRKEQSDIDAENIAGNETWVEQAEDVYLKTYSIFKSLLPYLIIAALIGIMIELFFPVNFLLNYKITGSPFGIVVAILVGAPIYLCNGAEVLFLRPLADSGGLPLGTAMAFSLSSTAICVTSLMMLVKFLGKRLSFLLLSIVIILILLLGITINSFRLAFF